MKLLFSMIFFLFSVYPVVSSAEVCIEQRAFANIKVTYNGQTQDKLFYAASKSFTYVTGAQMCIYYYYTYKGLKKKYFKLSCVTLNDGDTVTLKGSIAFGQVIKDLTYEIQGNSTFCVVKK